MTVDCKDSQEKKELKDKTDLLTPFGSFMKHSEGHLFSLQKPDAFQVLHGYTAKRIASGCVGYLESTYPNYVLKNAFSISSGSSVQGNIVVINATNTKYAIEFGPTGRFCRRESDLVIADSYG